MEPFTKRGKNNSLGALCTFSIFTLLLSVFFFTSCEMDVKEFFETYTETAAIVKMETEGSFPSGSNDAICFPSDDDHSILFYLRNPKKFTLQ